MLIPEIIRIPFVHGCRLTTPSRVRGGLVCNLSVQGAYVTLEEPLPETGESLQLAIAGPDQDPWIEAEAVVTSQNRVAPTGPEGLPPGIGLRFVTLPAPYRSRVEALLRDHNRGERTKDVAEPLHSGSRRVPYMRYGRLATGRGTLDALVCNISRLGAYVGVQPSPHIGDDVGLSFVAPDGSVMDLRAVVTWRSPEPAGESDPLPPGCGVRFVSPTPADESRIRTIVETLPRFHRP